MCNPVKQHFVPQSYLKKFSVSKCDDKIYTFNKEKPNNGIYVCVIKNAAFEKNIYTTSLNVEDNYIFEKELATIENDYSQLVNLMIKCINSKTLTDNLVKLYKNELIEMIHLQLVRTPHSKETFNVQFNNLKPQIFEEIVLKYLLDDHMKIELQNHLDSEKFSKQNLFVSRNIDNHERKKTETLKALLNYNIKFLVNNSNIKYITSDNPVVCKLNNKIGFGNINLLSPHTKIYFPISPEILIELHKDTNDIHLENVSQDIVSTLNKLQLKNAKRFIFSNEKTYISKCVDK